MLTFAFYKAVPGRFADKVIRLSSGSQYSHVEFLLTPPYAGEALSISASKRDGNKVREASIVLRDTHWDYLRVPGDFEDARLYARSQVGTPYNMISATLSITPIKKKMGSGVHCSWFMGDICNAAGLYVNDPWRLTPGELHQFLQSSCGLNNTIYDST